MKENQNNTMSGGEKRKRVMARSIKLGHCVCDPRKPCPCPLFKEKNVCTCAGEKVPLENVDKKVRLTEHIRSAGCASKIGQKDLHEVLKGLPMVQDPRLNIQGYYLPPAKLKLDRRHVWHRDVFTVGQPGEKGMEMRAHVVAGFIAHRLGQEEVLDLGIPDGLNIGLAPGRDGAVHGALNVAVCVGFDFPGLDL